MKSSVFSKLAFLKESFLIVEFNKIIGPKPANIIMIEANEDSYSISSEAY